jgi:Tfp pilus assembly protein PilO
LGVAIVLCGFFFANVLYKKQQQKLKVIDAEIAQREQEIALAKELVVLDDKLKAITTPYIKKETSFTIGKFSEFAASSGAKIISLSVDSDADIGLYTVTSYRLSAKGDYHSVGRFISALDSAGDIVKIEELSLSLAGSQVRRRKHKDSGKGNILNVNMRVSVSFIKTL